MPIVAISGHAGSGKDTTAGMLRAELENCGFKVLITHYADLVKYICRSFFEWNGEKDDHGRSLLQYVGTDVVRKKDPEYWVNFIIQILQFFPDEWDYVLIPDARFPNEIRSLQDAGFDVIHLRIERPDYDNGLTEEQKKHPSETSLDHTQYDYVIENNGTLGHLIRLVKLFAAHLRMNDYKTEEGSSEASDDSY